jgi:hypothetical protein
MRSMSVGNDVNDNDNAEATSSKLALDRQTKMRRQAAIIVAGLGVLGAIALVAFFTSSANFRSKFLGSSESLALHSMTDAKFACDKKVASKFGDLLQYATLNDISSRYDNDFGGYKLFYDVSVYRSKERNSGVKEVMYKCHIRDDGDVGDTGIIPSARTGNKDIQATDGNVFGF